MRARGNALWTFGGRCNAMISHPSLIDRAIGPPKLQARTYAAARGLNEQLGERFNATR